MVTHDLVQRGVAFEDGYAVASAIRDKLADREEVTTAELRDLIEEQLEKKLGADGLAGLRQPKIRPVPEIQVQSQGETRPFSRGVLARSIHAAGPDVDRAYELITMLVKEIRSEGLTMVSRGEIARRTGKLLDRHEGVETARRYRLVRRVRRLPRPLVIYVGGASGTGKSTLSLELAPLLRIYRINATDTIRQVMRMVFTPNILPALHSSSFEVAAKTAYGVAGERLEAAGGPVYVQRLVETYQEQATRVCVGVRAVVERAIAENMNILVEGVHLLPGLVPFRDLEGAVYQVPLFLATLNEEAHRAHFVARARYGRRGPERYVESFPSIRVIHDHILEQAEAADVPFLDTSDEETSVARALRIVTGVLQTKLPTMGRVDPADSPATAPTLLLILDGMTDRPVRSLGMRTPLQAARTPTLDRLAREGRTGLADPVAPGVVPDTASGTLALLGQSPRALQRGPVEAVGAGIKLEPGEIALRGNFATLDKRGRLIDRRAGRIREGAEELAKAIDRLPLPRQAGDIEIRARAGTEHRLAIVLRGDGLSSAILGSDPGDGAPPGPPLTPRPMEPTDDAAAFTAGVLAMYEQRAREVLAGHTVNKARVKKGLPPANTLITRGAGRAHRLVSLEPDGIPLRVVCIGGDRTVSGLASLVGAEIVTDPKRMTANLDTDLRYKFETVRRELAKNDLVLLHIKGADIASHDRRPDLKVEFLERLDKELGRFLERRKKEPLRIAVASDHATLSEVGQHAADPIPVLIWGEGVGADDVEAFDEKSAAGGSMLRFPLQMLLGRLFDLS
jgi:2,3-bisphosphoglycerate-independent phosphoglycerate mutase